jgi:hypothetical protein
MNRYVTSLLPILSVIVPLNAIVGGQGPLYVAGFAEREAVMPPLLLEPLGCVVVVPVTVTVNDASAVLLTASAARHSTVRSPGGRKYCDDGLQDMKMLPPTLSPCIS